MNKKTCPLTMSQYSLIVAYLRQRYKPVIADALVCQACTGLRISDVLQLRLSDIVWDGMAYRLDIVEKKTKKQRRFIIRADVYDWLRSLSRSSELPLFPVTARRLQQCLQSAAHELGFGSGIGTHSFRKLFACQLYTLSGRDIMLVSHALQHSSVATTQRYVAVSDLEVDRVLKEYDALI